MTADRTNAKPSAWRNLILAGAAVLVVAISVPVAIYMRPQSQRTDFEQTVFAPHPVTLAPGVHLLGGMSPGAAYVVETTDGLVLIDSGLDADAALLTQQLADLQLSLDKLRWILITHMHGDHSLGAKRLRQMTGAKVMAGAGDVEEMEQGGPREAFFSTFYMPGVNTHATKVDRALQGGETLVLGDARFTVISTPGHTPGSVCFLLERDKQRMLFTGDTISSITGDLGTYAAHLSPRYRASASDYLSSLEKLQEMPPPNLVLPGHPRLELLPQSPRLGEDQWQRLLDRGIRELREVLARYEADGRDFLDGVPKTILPDLHYLGEHADWSMYCLITDEGMILFDAPGEGPQLEAFVQSRLKELGVEAPALKAVFLTSCDAEPIGGLRDLVATTKCRVVADASGHALLRQELGEDAVIQGANSENVRKIAPARVITLRGLGESPVAYELTWADRRVLISGRIPTRVSERAVNKLRHELKGPLGDAASYVQCLMELREFDPQLWLPAHPTDGQNANLYGEQWKQTIDGNIDVFRLGL